MISMSLVTTLPSYALLSLSLHDPGPVSQKSRNFSYLFRVPQFLLYLRNAEVLSRQTFAVILVFCYKNKRQEIRTTFRPLHGHFQRHVHG